jgi:chromosome segregation ATPase
MTTNAVEDNSEIQAKLTAREQSLAAREIAVKDWERELKEKEDTLKDREADLKTQGERLTRTDSELKKSKIAVAAAEEEIVQRERLVTEREIEADAGFTTKNRETLAELRNQHTALRAQIEDTQAELDTTRMKGVKDLDSWLATERETRITFLDKELEAGRTRHSEMLRRERDEQNKVFAEQKSQLAEKQRELTDIKNNLEDKESELRRKESEVRLREEATEGLRAGIRREIEDQARDKVAALEQQLARLRENFENANSTVTSLQSQLDSYHHLFARFDENPEEWQRRFDELAQKNKCLQEELLTRPSASDKNQLNALLEQKGGWSIALDKLWRENERLSAEQHEWHKSVAFIEQHKKMREIAEKRLDVMTAETEKYKEDINRLTKLHERPAERAARIGTIEQPIFKNVKRADEKASLKELDWLGQIITACEASNMRFPKRLVHAFHTSLKAAEMSPLTVLSGVSGTGKSQLPQLYSRFGGIAFLSLPVQPNWDSPQSLFGFFNSIDNRFNATDVLRAMVQMQHSQKHENYENGLSDRLLLILLDEMNLAHVEQYFSDLLSGLEKRRGDDKDSVLKIDLGAGMESYSLILGRNVFWVGTMNEDETTKTLSDKVIDRANLLHFPRPKTLHSRTKVTLAPEAPLLAKDTWEKWIIKESTFTSEQMKPFKKGLEEINTRLEHVGRALGHRVWQSVEYYMANHPEVIVAHEDKNTDALERAMRRAYEDQLVLKVMPKLRGIETSGDSNRNCLEPIRSLIAKPELGLNLAEDFGIACKVGHGAFIWNSAKYLEKDE